MKEIAKKILFSNYIYPIFRKIYFPFFRLTGGRGGKPALNYLKKLQLTEFSSLSELELLQNEKLKNLINEVYLNVPFYRRVMDQKGMIPSDINSVNDLKIFPILTKKLIRENLDDLINRKFKKNKLKKITTGGTTGTPMMFYFGKHELGIKFAHIEKWKRVSGVRKYDKFMYLAFDPMAVNKVNYEGTFNHFGFYHMTSFGLNDDLMWKYLKNIKKYQPVYLRGVASACYLFADFFKKNKIRCPLKTVMTSSDMLHPYQRKVIEEVFCCEVFELYHQAEDVVIAHECENHSGFHIIMESCIPEIVNENGEPVNEGEQGIIIGTQLENYSMPLIRYETNDLGSISAVPCPCGRNHAKIRKLDGRMGDVIITPDGKKITGSMSRPMKGLYNEILEVQFIQKNINSLIVKYVPGQFYTMETEKKFEEKIRELTGKKIEITFNKVSKIEKTARGKHRLILSEINNRL